MNCLPSERPMSSVPDVFTMNMTPMLTEQKWIAFSETRTLKLINHEKRWWQSPRLTRGLCRYMHAFRRQHPLHVRRQLGKKIPSMLARYHGTHQLGPRGIVLKSSYRLLCSSIRTSAHLSPLDSLLSWHISDNASDRYSRSIPIAKESEAVPFCRR